jgi:NAD(P)H-hydrate epimerase
MNDPEAAPVPLKLRYITSDIASQIDEALMSPEGGFSIDQLMELAGLACAQTVYACYKPEEYPNILVAAGPGNQGGDGLVAARHLTHFGYNVSVWYPKEGKTELFAVSRGGQWEMMTYSDSDSSTQRLKKQLHNMKVPFVPADEFIDALEGADVVLDAIFGEYPV